MATTKTPKMKHIKGSLYAVKWAHATTEFDILKKESNLDRRSHELVRVRVGRRRTILTVSNES